MKEFEFEHEDGRKITTTVFLEKEKIRYNLKIGRIDFDFVVTFPDEEISDVQFYLLTREKVLHIAFSIDDIHETWHL